MLLITLAVLALVASAASNSITPFFPGCYEGDTSTLTITVVLDASAVDGNQAAALAKLNSQLSYGKVLFLEQLNIRLEVNKVIFGKNSDPVPLSRSGNTCTTAIGALRELGSWLKTHKQDSAFTMLVSNCFAGVSGATNLGSACGSRGYGTAQFNMLTILHELGHGIGMPHTFQLGVRTTGGLMDYGDGKYNGVVQFHPSLSRSAVCGFLHGMASRNCPHFTSTLGSKCGDGFLQHDEECECIDKSQSCGVCIQCKLTKPVECSASRFVVRTSQQSKVAIADASQLFDSKCCTKANKFAPAKTLCGENNLNACGAQGQCVPICTKYMLPDNANCGFDASGCNLGCVFENKCRFDLLGASKPLSRMPDGTPCKLNGSAGTCHAGVCH